MAFRQLRIYQKAFQLAMQIFETSKSFPKEETYALTDQIRRSSRSVCANLAEAYRKRVYRAHFISKITDAEMENSETTVWLEFAKACNYVDASTFAELNRQNDEIGKMLFHMRSNPEKFS